MLKIKNKKGELVAELLDEGTEPTFIKDKKKKNKNKDKKEKENERHETEDER